MCKFKDKDVMNIVYASDDRFSEIMGISIISLFENNKEIEEIEIYILDGGICDDNRLKLESIFLKYCRSLPHWIQTRDISNELGIVVNVDRGSISQYSRLFISRDLPETLSRVIYLDCDTLILGSLWPLWKLDLQGNTIGALNDAFSRYYRKNIDLEFKDVMFNSGVMVVDLDLWRDVKVEEKLLNFIINKRGRVQQGDQGALNAILSKDTYCFDPVFNVVSLFFDFTYDEILRYRKPPEFYTKTEIENAVKFPIIIHFTTSFRSIRPWIKGCNHQYVSTWNGYKKNSPWMNEPLWKNNRPMWKKTIDVIYEMLPRNIAIFVASIFQIYVRPLYFRMKHLVIF